MGNGARPNDNNYFRSDRTILFSQGDIFANVPFIDFGEPSESGTEVVGSRKSFAMLITPTFVMRARGATSPQSYATPIRTVIPILPLTVISVTDRDALDRDELVHYMFLPGDPGASKLPESVAILSEPTTVSHDLLMKCGRATQLTVEATRQLQLKLVRFYSSIEWRSVNRDAFDPWPD
jgi:hypothetical protein